MSISKNVELGFGCLFLVRDFLRGRDLEEKNGAFQINSIKYSVFLKSGPRGLHLRDKI